MQTIDIGELIPSELYGKQVEKLLNKDYVYVSYKAKRTKPKPVKLNRYVNRDLFIAGVMAWICEGSRKESTNYLEISNSSEVVMRVFTEFLKQLGVCSEMRVKVHAPADRVKFCQRKWSEILSLKLKYDKPIKSVRKIYAENIGILHVRVYSKVLKGLIKYWSSILSNLLQ